MEKNHKSALFLYYKEKSWRMLSKRIIGYHSQVEILFSSSHPKAATFLGIRASFTVFINEKVRPDDPNSARTFGYLLNHSVATQERYYAFTETNLDQAFRNKTAKSWLKEMRKEKSQIMISLEERLKKDFESSSEDNSTETDDESNIFFEEDDGDPDLMFRKTIERIKNLDKYAAFLKSKDPRFISPQWMTNFQIDDFFVHLNNTYSHQYSD
ncbi:MAG: hypothetical protein AAF242_08525, partial [Bacteroidota bacterium]